MKMLLKSAMAGAFVSLAMVAVPGVVSAAPLGPCGGTGASFLSNFINFNPATGGGTSNGASCTNGDKTFSNFSYSPTGAFMPMPLGGTNPVPATQVGVGAALTPFPGLLFTAGWSAIGIPGDAFITFAVQETGGGTSIADAELLLSGADSPLVKDTEDLSVGTSAGGPGIGNITVTGPSGTPSAMGSLPFTPEASVFVSDNLSVAAGHTASDLEKQFSQVPEPASLAILAVSLLGMGAALRRHRRR